MSELYGYTNKVLAKLNSHILQYPALNKFLYYTADIYKEKDILAEPEVSISKLYNEHYFVYKRLPEVIEKAGAYMFVDVYRLTPTTLGGKLREITFTIDIFVHRECLETPHGNRAVCLMSALEEALVDYVQNYAIGSIDLIRVAPLLGVVNDFTGYSLQFRAYGFK